MDVLVVGGTGFIGRVLCRVLDERGHTVTAASRSPAARELPESVKTVSLDVTQPDLTEALRAVSAETVVNLVALASHIQPREQSHAVHSEGTRNLVRACERTGVEQFIQMSGLGVEGGVQTAYFRAKREAETIVKESALEWVIYRPSVVFGDGCAFIPFIESIQPPLVAVLPGGGSTRIQPIWVGDLASMLAECVEDASHSGEIYQIGGPEPLTLAETVAQINDTRATVSVPMSVASLVFSLAEVLPGVPFGRDQYRVFGLNNTTPPTENDIAAFGLSPEDLLTLQEYLNG